MELWDSQLKLSLNLSSLSGRETMLKESVRHKHKIWCLNSIDNFTYLNFEAFFRPPTMNIHTATGFLDRPCTCSLVFGSWPGQGCSRGHCPCAPLLVLTRHDWVSSGNHSKSDQSHPATPSLCRHSESKQMLKLAVRVCILKRGSSSASDLRQVQ